MSDLEQDSHFQAEELNQKSC